MCACVYKYVVRFDFSSVRTIESIWTAAHGPLPTAVSCARHVEDHVASCPGSAHSLVLRQFVHSIAA